MHLLLRICWCAYDLSLSLYPRDLRDAFGADMSQVFREQTLDAWAHGGWRLLRPALWYGVRELFTEALPACIGSPALVAGASSLVCTSTIFLCLLWSLENPLGVKAVGDRLHQIVWGRAAATRAIHRTQTR